MVSPAAVGLFLFRRRRSERGRPAAVTGGGAVGGYASTGTRPLSRFRKRRRAGVP